jgi:FkbM family methyltransferase
MLQAVREYLGTIRHRQPAKSRAIAAAKITLAWHKIRGRKGSGSIELLGLIFNFGDFDLFFTLFNEVFVAKTYLLTDLPASPTIIDAGGNIGMATLFFKYYYPEAKIFVFEPDETNFSYLQKNITSNKLTRVTPFNIALSDTKGKLTLYERSDVNGGDIGVSLSRDFRGNYHKDADIVAIEVPTDKLSSLMPSKVDLMKIDIEGGEAGVFKDLDDQEKLGAIANIVMEFHKIPENPLPTLLSRLEKYHHTFEIHQWGNDPHNASIAHCIIKTHRSS